MNKKEEFLQIDMEGAWKRLMERVKDEPAPAAWKHVRTAGSPDLAADAFVPKEPVQETVAAARIDGEGVLKPSAGKWYPRLKRYAAPAIAACLVLFLTVTPLGEKVMASMIQRFRVQHLNGVQWTQQDMAELQNALRTGVKQGETFSLDKFGSLEVAGGGRSQQMIASEAGQSLSQPIKLFPGMTSSQIVTVRPAMDVTMRLHVAQVNETLKMLGGNKQFPPSADNRPIAFHVPAIVTVEQNGADGLARKSLTQLDVPELDVPTGIDVDQVRGAVLDLPFIPDSLRGQIRGTLDWKNTLFVPLDDKSRELEIDGRSAVIRSDSDPGGNRSLMWLQDGEIFMISGTNQAYPTDDSIIREAKELIAS